MELKNLFRESAELHQKEMDEAIISDPQAAIARSQQEQITDVLETAYKLTMQVAGLGEELRQSKILLNFFINSWDKKSQEVMALKKENSELRKRLNIPEKN